MIACILRALVPALFLIGVAGATKSASAQVFLDLYGGIARTADANVNAQRVTTNFITVTIENASRSVAYDRSFTAGGRYGSFEEWFGFALDVSYFRADSNDSNVKHGIVSLTPMILARARLLQSDDLPQGRLQPYLGIGPGIFFVYQKVDFRPAITSTINNLDIHVGIDARAGLRWLITENMGLFGEYRLTDFYAESINDLFTINGLPTSQVKAPLSTHHLLAGITFNF